MEEEEKVDWGSTGRILFRFVFNIFYNSFLMWFALNLFFVAFKTTWYLTFLQSFAICFLYVAISLIFGLGDK